ncbi:MAG: hypothetical protein AABY11_02520 [archaeon]
MSPLFYGIIALLVFSSGCLSLGDGNGVAISLREERHKVMEDGLVAPLTMAQQNAYSETLLSFRKTIRENGGSDQPALNDYVDASLALVNMTQALHNGNEALVNAADAGFACGTGTYMHRAREHFESAKTHAQLAQRALESVLSHVTLSNTLGADFLHDAHSTVSGNLSLYENRIQEIQNACA